MCDVAREDASVVIADLKRLDIHREGSITLELIDTAISDVADRAEKHARGAPADAVVWEEVEARTNEQVELSGVFLHVHGPGRADRDRRHLPGLARS